MLTFQTFHNTKLEKCKLHNKGLSCKVSKLLVTIKVNI